MAATDKGTAAAVGPMVVPRIHCVNGKSSTSKIRNGMERIIFATNPNTTLNIRFSENKPRSLTKSNMPIGMPSTIAIPSEMPTMYKVS
ncbi:Uncharacterised protein [Mycobacterium tuberculosis]|nr:Uncharacterised protein [Mycobacterium tuberculosis]